MTQEMLLHALRESHARPLVFDRVTVRYPARDRDALHDVSVRAAAGQITAVVGPNGSGKSTLVRTLLGRVSMTAGRVLLGDADLASWDAKARAQQVAIVPQREEPSMPLRVEEFVALGRHARRTAFGGMSRTDTQAVGDAMHRAGVQQDAARRIDTLSGGEWQRVRIARALAQSTGVLVLDEPTTFLDIAHEMAVFELLDELARDGHTVLLVSHQLNLVARFAAHIVLLHEGTVAAAGDVHEVMRGEILERVYDWPLVVTRDPAVGAPAMLPLRGRGSGRGGARARDDGRSGSR